MHDHSLHEGGIGFGRSPVGCAGGSNGYDLAFLTGFAGLNQRRLLAQGRGRVEKCSPQKQEYGGMMPNAKSHEQLYNPSCCRVNREPRGCRLQEPERLVKLYEVVEILCGIPRLRSRQMKARTVFAGWFFGKPKSVADCLKSR